MIGYLKGALLSKREKTILLNVANVGYEVHAPRGLIEKLTSGEEYAFFIHTNVREDDLSLYGLPTEREMTIFKMLISVSGIGPRTGLEMMNAPLENLQNAIAHKDLAYLTKLPGIGKKTAERICVDLSSKIMEIGEPALNYTKMTVHETNDDLIHALTSLGYKRTHVIQGLKRIPSEIKEDEAVIKYFLQNCQ